MPQAEENMTLHCHVFLSDRTEQLFKSLNPKTVNYREIKVKQKIIIQCSTVVQNETNLSASNGYGKVGGKGEIKEKKEGGSEAP